MKYDIVEQRFVEVYPSNIQAVDFDGENIWFATHDSIFQIVDDTIKPICINEGLKQINSMLVCEDFFYLGTSSGLFIIDTDLKTQQLISDVYVTSIFKSKGDDLYIATLEHGVYQLRQRRIVNHMKHDHQVNSISCNQVRCFAEDDRGDLWIATFNGLNKLDVTTG